jgi:hypothetical protein
MKYKYGPKRPATLFSEAPENNEHAQRPNSLQEARSFFESKLEIRSSETADYAKLTDDQLYRRARELDIPKRSYLVREDLIEAIRKAEGS